VPVERGLTKLAEKKTALDKAKEVEKEEKLLCTRRNVPLAEK
jgi:hypothetical protein